MLSSGLSAAPLPLRRTTATSSPSSLYHKRASALFKGRPPPRARHASAARHGRRLSKLQSPSSFVAGRHPQHRPYLTLER
jgi:hypothetical protein